MKEKSLDTIIIGGSHAGLSAALVLGRSLRYTLIIDSGKPRNEPSPEAHSVYTRDGQNPMVLIKLGREQLKPYTTVSLDSGYVQNAKRTGDGFEIEHLGRVLRTKTVILATGLTDLMPDIPGFQELWGKKVLHCPFCHGFEALGLKIGYIGKPGSVAQSNIMYGHWYDDLVMLTNGQEFSSEELRDCSESGVPISAGKIQSLANYENGLTVTTEEGVVQLGRLYWDIPVRRNSALAEEIGCELEPEPAPGKGRLVKVDKNFETTVDGVYAIGDLSLDYTQVAAAMYSGSKAAFAINQKLWGFDCRDPKSK